MKQHKTDAVILLSKGHAPGVAHVTELEYREGLTFCCFVMEVTTDSKEMVVGSINTIPIGEIIFPDERAVTVMVSQCKVVEGDYLELVGSGVI